MRAPRRYGYGGTCCAQHFIVRWVLPASDDVQDTTERKWEFTSRRVNMRVCHASDLRKKSMVGLLSGVVSIDIIISMNLINLRIRPPARHRRLTEKIFATTCMVGWDEV